MARPSSARENLVTAAKELIYESSYAGAGVQAICERAGVRKGSFYHFFPHKEDLALAAIDEFAADHRARFDGIMRAEGTLTDRLRRWFEAAYAAQDGEKARSGHVRGCPLGNLALERSAQDEAIRERLNTVFKSWRGALAGVIQEAMNRGEIPAGDPEVAAEALIAYQEGAVLLAKTHNDPTWIRRLADGALALLKGGVGSRPTAEDGRPSS